MRRTGLTIAHIGDPQVFVIGIHEGYQSGGSVHTEPGLFEELGISATVYDGLYRRLGRLKTPGKYFEYVTCNCTIEGSCRV